VYAPSRPRDAAKRKRSVVALLAWLCALSAGCLGSLDAQDGQGGMTGSTDQGGPATDPKDLFARTVQPILDQACRSCHVAAAQGPAFLEPKPDEYTAIKAWPGLVGKDRDASLLYTKGAHEGPPFTEPQGRAVGAWIDAEAAARQKPGPTPELPSFEPQSGPNVVDLTPLKAELAGAKLTFQAGFGGAGLTLDQLALAASAQAAVHIVHPLFTVHHADGSVAVDASDALESVDTTVAKGTQSTLGVGLVVLPGFQSGDRLSIQFETLEVAGSAGPSASGCKDVGAFTANATPSFKASCTRCHGGTDTSATSAFDMTRMSDPSAAGQAAACAQALGEVSPSQPASSRIFVVTRPGATDGHPFSLDSAGLAAFQQAITRWIERER
jgi:hypothetical protein